MPYDAIIIGSGLGGLACATLLAKAGQRVLVLERQSQIGGCMQSYKRHGLEYDTGLHYIGGLDEGQPLHEPFKQLGLLDLNWKRLDPNGFDRIRIGQRNFSFAQGYEAFVDTLATEFPNERKGLQQYVDTLRGMQPGAHAPLQETGAWDFLHQIIHDELLINVLSAASQKMELRKETLPLFTFAHGNASYIQSAWRLQGSGSTLVKRLSDQIKACGGEIKCNHEVSKLTEKDGLITAAHCANGDTFEAKLFISDAHPAITCSWMEESKKMRRVYRRRISSLHNTVGMFTVSLRIKNNSLPYFNYNQYVYREANVWDFYRHPSTEVGGLLISCRVPEDGGCYARQVDLITPMLWEEVSPWQDTHTGQRGDAYLLMKRQRAEACISLAETAIPHLRECVEGYITSTPLTYRDYNLSPQGSAFGIRKDYRQPLLTTLSPQTPIPNLLLTGQNLVAHGVEGVTIMATETCKMATKRLSELAFDAP